MAAKPLDWRKPTDHPQDRGCEPDNLFVADGIGGRYSIDAELKGGGFILWWADDEFTFVECVTVDEAKAKAEADWQERYAALADGASSASTNEASQVPGMNPENGEVQ